MRVLSNIVWMTFFLEAIAQSLPRDCTKKVAGRSVELIEIATVVGSEIFEVYCDLNDLDDKAWMVIFIRKQIRYEYDRWDDYEQGYNTLSGNYFIGLERLSAITQWRAHELSAHLTSNDGVQHYLHYENFAIGDESSNYSVSVRDKHFGSALDIQLSDWLPWQTGPLETIKRMKLAIRPTNDKAAFHTGEEIKNTF